MTQGEETADETREVRDILERIAAEGEIARIDARLEELADETERAAAEAQRALGVNRRELELMRARIEDALEYVGETTATQREAWEQTSARLDEVARSLGSDLERTVQAAREEMRRERDRTQAAAEELELLIRGEVEQARADAEELVAGSRNEVAELRTELEGASGELRAGQNLAAQRFEELVDALRSELTAAVTAVRERVTERDREVSEGLDSVGQQLRASAERLGEAIDREREARATAERTMRDDVDEVRSRLEEVDSNATSLAGRQDVELGRIQGLLTDLSGRIEALDRSRTAASPPSAEAVAGLSERLDDLAERIQRTESIARESGRLLLNLLRKRHDEVGMVAPPVEETAEHP